MKKIKSSNAAQPHTATSSTAVPDADASAQAKSAQKPPKKAKPDDTIHLSLATPSEKEFAELSPEQQTALRNRLQDCKRRIEVNIAAWHDLAQALLEIRDARLYRAEGYSDFGKYCREQLGLGKSTVTRRIAAEETYCKLASAGVKTLPSSERQLRPLLPLRKPQAGIRDWGEAVNKVWQKAVADCELNRVEITEKAVLRASQALGYTPIHSTASPENDLAKRWAKLEATILHEREFWPEAERLTLEKKLTALISTWAEAPTSSRKPRPRRKMRVKDKSPEPLAVTADNETGGERAAQKTDGVLLNDAS